MADYSSKKEYGQGTVASENQKVKDYAGELFDSARGLFKKVTSKKPPAETPPETEGSDAAKQFVKGFTKK